MPITGILKKRFHQFIQWTAATALLVLIPFCASTLRGPVPNGESIVLEAKQFLGTPYSAGGSHKEGMDCSGLVVRVFSQASGKSMPHSADRLFKMGRPVSLRSLQQGDLVFFRENRGDTVSHVGIYLGNMEFIHASLRGVIISRLDSAYYQSRFAGARRLYP
ncbi:MAG TPA: peptidoglycan endopeptidase [bacterium]|nr:peptidoglycan endopeptidase [bacterium]